MKTNNGDKKITDALLSFWEGIIFPYLEKRFGKVEDRLDKVEGRLEKVEGRLEKVETELTYVKDDVRNLKADAPTNKEFQGHEKRIKHLENTVFIPQ
jgi:archaellum component FlaC